MRHFIRIARYVFIAYYALHNTHRITYTHIYVSFLLLHIIYESANCVPYQTKYIQYIRMLACIYTYSASFVQKKTGDKRDINLESSCIFIYKARRNTHFAYSFRKSSLFARMYIHIQIYSKSSLLIIPIVFGRGFYFKSPRTRQVPIVVNAY